MQRGRRPYLSIPLKLISFITHKTQMVVAWYHQLKLLSSSDQTLRYSWRNTETERHGSITPRDIDICRNSFMLRLVASHAGEKWDKRLDKTCKRVHKLTLWPPYLEDGRETVREGRHCRSLSLSQLSPAGQTAPAPRPSKSRTCNLFDWSAPYEARQLHTFQTPCLLIGVCVCV